jgi:hypothetical protein
VQIGRVLLGVLIVVAGATAARDFWFARPASSRRSIRIAMAWLFAAAAVVVGGVIAVQPGLPGVLNYQGEMYFVGQGGQGVYGAGDVTCVTRARIPRATPSDRLGYITWVSWDSETGSVGSFPHGHAVFPGAGPNSLYIERGPDCFVYATANSG